MVEHIYTGYFVYLDNDIDELLFAADEFDEFGLDYLLTEENLDDGENPYENAHVFLMGSCNLFALALNEKFGYALCQIDKGSSHHYFCITEYVDKNGEKQYPLIDVRGMTTDFLKFRRTSCVPTAAVEDVEKMVIDEGLASDVIGIEYAKRIIERHPEFYDVKYLDK